MSDSEAMELSSGDCTFSFRRPAEGVLLVAIRGLDRGELGEAPLAAIREHFHAGRPLELFVDASQAIGAAVEVSDAWTRFFAEHQRSLKRVHVLAGSKVVQLTVAIAQHLSRTGNLVQIYSDREIFEDRLRLARGSQPRPSG